MMNSDALEGYRFFFGGGGEGQSFYSVSCMCKVMFNSSPLNWPLGILSVAHNVCVCVIVCVLRTDQEDFPFLA